MKTQKMLLKQALANVCHNLGSWIASASVYTTNEIANANSEPIVPEYENHEYLEIQTHRTFGGTDEIGMHDDLANLLQAVESEAGVVLKKCGNGSGQFGEITTYEIKRN